MIFGFIILSSFNGHKSKLLALSPHKGQTVLFIMILKIIALSCLEEEDPTKLDLAPLAFLIGKQRYGQNYFQIKIRIALGKEHIIHQSYFTPI